MNCMNRATSNSIRIGEFYIVFPYADQNAYRQKARHYGISLSFLTLHTLNYSSFEHATTACVLFLIGYVKDVRVVTYVAHTFI